jgi:hypothetical protein
MVSIILYHKEGRTVNSRFHFKQARRHFEAIGTKSFLYFGFGRRITVSNKTSFVHLFCKRLAVNGRLNKGASPA